MKKKQHIKYLTSIFLVLFYFLIPAAEAKFQFNANCQQAMQDILDLRFRDAKGKIEQEKLTNPDNGYIIYLEHYSKVIELIISEDPALYEDIIDHYEERMERMDELDDGTPDNSWLQAEMLFHTGLAQVKYGTRINGVSKMVSSYRRIREHRQKHPLFWQNQKLNGVYNIMLDFVPPFMRWATDLFGFSGDAATGMFELTQYYDRAKAVPGLAEEGALVVTLGYKLTRDDLGGFRFLGSQEKMLQACTLARYLYAVGGLNTSRNSLALEQLSKIDPKRLQSNFYGFYYTMGRCKLNHLEPDADTYFHYFLENYPGEDYRKDICNRLSYYYFLKGDMARYAEYRDKTIQSGEDLRENDHEALLESQSGLVPHAGLLKARLLCDGGYFPESMAILQGIDPAKLEEPGHRVEYHYRLGRVLQLTGKTDEAITRLTQAYDQGKLLPYTYSTRAALQLGKIYEEKKDYRSALMWYDRCVDVYSSAHTAEGVKDSAERGAKRAKAQF